MNTRAVAAKIVIRIQEHGAYSNVVLPQETRDLDGPDRAFVYSLVTGMLRRQRLVDLMIERASSRPIGELDPEVRSILEVAAAELITDKRGASYATVNESVEAIRALGRPKAATFVNAVLRRLSEEGAAAIPFNDALALSVPDWLFDSLVTDHGIDAGALLAGLRKPSPHIGLRARPGSRPPADAIAVPGVPGAFRVTAPPTVDGVVIADAASTAVGLAAAPQVGERVLDMAAAPGGKTIHLWDQLDGTGSLIAMDRHARRLRSARRRLARLGVTPSWLRADGVATPFCDGSFDLVLVDAPCTGLGTLRRRPEIAMRLDADAPARQGAQQRRLLAEAWRITRPGGRIVYSVCTVFATETIDVVADYPAHPPAGLPGREWGSGLLLAPHLTDTDGMFIAVLDR